jgi:DNA polymerase III sliding clamp (beta) subunit (PCNA family)
MARKKKSKDAIPDSPHGSYVEFGADHLRDRLALFKHIVVKRASRKDLASYHFTVRPDGSAIVAGTDLENRLQVKLEIVRRYGQGTVMIDTHALNAMIGSYVEPRVRLHLDDPKKVQVGGLNTKLILPGYDPQKELKATAEGSLTRSGWLIRGDYLATAIEKTRFAVQADESTRYALSGIAMSFPEAGEESMEFVATDGRRLSKYRIPVKPFGTDPARVWRPDKTGGVDPLVFLPLIGNKVVPLALKLAREAGTGAVGIAVIPGEVKNLERDEFHPGSIQVVTRDAVLTAKIAEGRFPRFRDVYPNVAVVAELRLDDASKLGDFVGTAVAATDSEHKGVEMVLAGGCLMMTVESETKGKAVLSLLVPDSNGKATFDLDALMFRQFFDVVGNERLRMRFYGKSQPLVLQAGPNHEFVIMPLTRDESPRVVKPVPVAEPEPEPVADEPGEDDGEEPVILGPEPVPVAPVAVSPDAHVGNGKARRQK